MKTAGGNRGDDGNEQPAVRFRFGSDRRLKRQGDFDRAFAQGIRQRTKGLLLVVTRNDLGRTRLGISVGRRYGNAVERNRIKRRLREAFRLEQWQIPPGFDAVVVPRKELRDVPVTTIRVRLLHAIRDARRGLEKRESRLESPPRDDTDTRRADRPGTGKSGKAEP